MSEETRDLVTICERLPAAQRAEVADFARFLLAKLEGGGGAAAGAGASDTAVHRWLASARGAAEGGMTTDQLRALTRGDP